MILGPRRYFMLVSRCFLILYHTRLLRLFSAFDTHYGVRKLVRQGDRVIDIGANMGYYTTIFASLAGDQGRVSGIEPVSLYREILEKNCSKYGNVEILPYALGDSGGVVQMGIPGKMKYRHGLTRILEGNTPEEEKICTAEVKRPEELFNNIGQVDYIKCDIEGFEDRVIPGFKDIIEKYLPIIQIEISDENHDFIKTFLLNFGYREFRFRGRFIYPAEKYPEIGGDSIFIPGRTVDNLFETYHLNIKNNNQ